MKVLHLYSSWTKGGAEKVMLLLIKGLQDKGITNLIASPKGSFILDEAARLGVRAYPLTIRGSFAPFGLLGLLEIMIKERPDIIHAHQGKVFWPCVFMKWFFPRTKLVFHRHAQIPHKFYSRLHYLWADKVIAISKVVKEGLVISEGVNPDKIEVIYNGVDLESFNERSSGEEVRKKYGLLGKLVIGTAGAMNPPKGKGQGYLIEAAAVLKDRFPDARYLIVGTGPIQKELEAYAAKREVSDIVIFTGYQEDIVSYMSAMDVFCLLSWEMEGLGQVMLEAQALGKPVIGTNVGGIPETFKTGETGFLIPKEDVFELCRVLALLGSDNDKRSAMGRAGASLVRERFSFGRMIENTASLYKTMAQ